MSTARLRRKLAFLLLVVFLAGSGLAAAEPLQGMPGQGFWHWLQGLWAKAGCILDPNGLCDAGCGLDPDGRCVSGPGSGAAAAGQGDEGCGIDPDGRCGS